MTKKLLFIALLLFVPQFAGATVYYIDFGTTTSGTGLTKDLAYRSIDEFTAVARSAGDIAFVRRGQATTTGIIDLAFTSDGTVASPITISADYDNIWGTNATSAVTWTATFGSKFLASSASSTDFGTANKWVYLMGDCAETGATATVLNTCAYAYEVASTSPAGIDLYLPYKGNQSGSGKEMRVMLANPVWNTAAGDFQWNFDLDQFWTVKGIHVKGTDANGQIEIDSGGGQSFEDMILEGNGASDTGLGLRDDTAVFVIKKSRIFNNVDGVQTTSGTGFNWGSFFDILIDCQNVATSFGIEFGMADNVYLDSVEFIQCVTDLRQGASNLFGMSAVGRNVDLSAATFVAIAGKTDRLYFEDYEGIVGDNRQFLHANDADEGANILSTTTNLRVGGGPINAYVNPRTDVDSLSANSRLTMLKLFEYPIYTDDSSKTYTMYFNSTSTTGWTNDPTASEFWIECEYYAETSGADRHLKKSTGVVDFNGSTTWQTLSVTCDPTQSGILYLRGWYGKPKEAGSNFFFMDTTPVIS